MYVYMYVCVCMYVCVYVLYFLDLNHTLKLYAILE